MRGGKVETARVAQAISGEKLYQLRARAAFPLLVRQAHARSKIFYSDLAAELGMPNPRNLNYVLGSIGTALEDLGKQWGEKIPVLQCLVVNKETGVPGEGIGWFVRDKGEFDRLTRRQQQGIVEGVLGQVFAYPRWLEVLKALGLDAPVYDFKTVIGGASSFRGGGESAEHRALKHFVADNPSVVGLPHRTPKGAIECRLPSGDSVDVMFFWRGIRYAVEVKPQGAPVSDVVRGLFQCVKYAAVVRAQIAAENSDEVCDARLVLGGALPGELAALRNILDVEVVECIHASPAAKNGGSESEP